jgi:hypothetical protein
MAGNLIQQIQNSIDNYIEQFINNISEKYEIDKDELLKLWDSGNLSNCEVKCLGLDKAQKKTITITITKPSPTKTDVSSASASEGCPYVYTKGEKEGHVCNIKPKGGVVFCTRHKKYEGLEPKQKKILPSTKKSIGGNTVVTKKEPVKKEVNTVLRKNKAIDMLWHSPTGMVFKSAKERIVVGKCVNDKVLPLTKDDIEICMSHSFAYEEINSKSQDKITNNDSDSDNDSEEEIVEEKISVPPARVTPKLANSIAPKKSMTDAIAKTKMQAQDVELILSELQITKSNVKSNVDEDLFIDSDDDEDLLEEEDDE